MKNTIVTICLTGIVSLPLMAQAAGQDSGYDGEALFMKNCIACHADGGNEVNPAKTLFQKDREKNGITTADAIVKLLRNPGPGMLTFDRDTLSDEAARAIAEYVLKTFK